MHDQSCESNQSTDTRRHIASVATRLFAHQGFDGTSIRDIVEAAGVTKPVLYYYFKSKEELYVTLLHEAYSTFINNLRDTIDTPHPFTQKLRQVIHLYFQDCEKKEDEDIVRLIFMVFFGPRRNAPPEAIFKLEETHFQILQELFGQGQKDGFIRNELIEEVVLFFIGSVTIHLMLLVMGGPMPEHFEKHIYELLMNGIGKNKKNK